MKLVHAALGSKRHPRTGCVIDARVDDRAERFGYADTELVRQIAL